MTRRTRTSREAENRLDALESERDGAGNVVGWFDWMDYSIECAGAENPPSPEEVFGDGWTYPDAGWVENLRAAGYDLSNESKAAGADSRDSVSLTDYHDLDGREDE